MKPKAFVRAAAAVPLYLILCTTEPGAAQTTRYVVLVDGGTRAGHHVVTRLEDGVTEVDFIFKDNGRGPELRERYTIDADHTFRTYEVSGTLTFGAPVAETFGREGERAHWTSSSDRGEIALSGPALYSPLGGSLEWVSVAVGALAARADGRLPLIPNGTLTMRQLAEMRIESTAGDQVVQLVALTGVGLRPTFVWATTAGPPRMFAFITPGWMQLIEEGWEGSADALEARQAEAEGDALQDLQRRLAQPLGGTTLIRNARIFDSEHATLGDAADVLLRAGRIVSIMPAAAAPPAADQVIDGGGRVLLPGLIDSHGHLGRWDGPLNIAAGVTTVRDMGNDNATLQQLMRDVDAGRLLGTRIVPTGFIEGESEFSSRTGFVIRDLAAAKRAVDWYADNGYGQVKIYNSFPRELLRETAAYAHARGLRVSGHVPAFMRARDVVEQGYDEIQHINQLLLNFLATDETDTRTLERFRLVAEGVADLDFDSEPVRDFVALLASRKVVVDPTVATFDFIRQRPGTMSQAFAAVAEHLPPDVQRSLRNGEMDIPDDETAERYDRSYRKLVEFVGRLHSAGVPIVAGTDWIPGFTLQRELELYVQAGMSPAQALRTATWNAATYAGVLSDRGAITEGRRADLILVDGDPTRNIGDIRNVALVIMGVTAYTPADVYDAIGIRPFASPLRVIP